MQFGKNLAAALAKKGLTQAALAVEAHVSQGAISRYLNGKASPKAEELHRISAALSTPMEWLLTGQGPDSYTALFDGAIRDFVKTNPSIRDSDGKVDEVALWKLFDVETSAAIEQLEAAQLREEEKILAESTEDFVKRLDDLDRMVRYYFHDVTKLAELAKEAAGASRDKGIALVLRGMSKSMDEIRPHLQEGIHSLMSECLALREIATAGRPKKKSEPVKQRRSNSAEK